MGLTSGRRRHSLQKSILVASHPMALSFSLSPEEVARRKAEREAYDALSRVEQIALKIDELERNWSVLGPLRPITFTVLFRDEAAVEPLARAAKENGFDVAISNWANGEPSYKEFNATLVLKPSPQEIERWEIWFDKYASAVPDVEQDDGQEEDGAEFQGWSYPTPVKPVFSLNGKPRNKSYQNHEGSIRRTQVLFGETLCEFEPSNGWADKKGACKSGPFQIVPSEFIKIARRRCPNDPEPTVSGFSQWLYSLYSNVYGRDEDKERGELAEPLILQERKKAFVATDYKMMRDKFPGWRLKHNGMKTDQSDRPNYFGIRELLVNGTPLRACPDLIYENTITGARLIVEVKHSYMTIPDNLWPNIWGQLWCYSQMRDIVEAPAVTVVGEVWGDKTYYGCSERYVYLRASVRRDPRAPAFDRFFRTLFDIYRGA